MSFKQKFKIASYVVLAITFIAALSLAIMYFVVTDEKNRFEVIAYWKVQFLDYYAATNALIIALNVPFWLVKIWLLIDQITMKMHRDKESKKNKIETYKKITTKMIKNKMLEKEKQEKENILKNEKNKINYIKDYFYKHGITLTNESAAWIYKHLKHENAYLIKDYIYKECAANVMVDIIENLINEK